MEVANPDGFGLLATVRSILLLWLLILMVGLEALLLLKIMMLLVMRKLLLVMVRQVVGVSVHHHLLLRLHHGHGRRRVLDGAHPLRLHPLLRLLCLVGRLLLRLVQIAAAAAIAGRHLVSFVLCLLKDRRFFSLVVFSLSLSFSFSLSVCEFILLSSAKMMHMTLYWSRYVTLLVDSWRTDSWLSYALTLLACFICSAFYQYMEDRRIRIRSAAPNPSEPQSASTPLIPKLGRFRRVNSAKLASAALFGINSAVGYLLMLAIMSFNGGVFLAIVAGLTVGHYLFRSGDEDQISAVENPCACA